MKLELGKYYVNGDVKVRGPIVETGCPTYPFSDGERTYTVEGVWDKRRPDHPRNLIREHTPEPTLFRDMSDAEKLGLYEAQNAGKPVDYFSFFGWSPKTGGTFYDGTAYRVRPEPRVETRTDYIRLEYCGVFIVVEEHASHEITYQIIDGKPNWSNATFEAVKR